MKSYLFLAAFSAASILALPTITSSDNNVRHSGYPFWLCPEEYYGGTCISFVLLDGICFPAPIKFKSLRADTDSYEDYLIGNFSCKYYNKSQCEGNDARISGNAPTFPVLIGLVKSVMCSWESPVPTDAVTRSPNTRNDKRVEVRNSDSLGITFCTLPDFEGNCYLIDFPAKTDCVNFEDQNSKPLTMSSASGPPGAGTFVCSLWNKANCAGDTLTIVGDSPTFNALYGRAISTQCWAPSDKLPRSSLNFVAVTNKEVVTREEISIQLDFCTEENFEGDCFPFMIPQGTCCDLGSIPFSSVASPVGESFTCEVFDKLGCISDHTIVNGDAQSFGALRGKVLSTICTTITPTSLTPDRPMRLEDVVNRQVSSVLRPLYARKDYSNSRLNFDNEAPNILATGTVSLSNAATHPEAPLDKIAKSDVDKVEDKRVIKPRQANSNIFSVFKAINYGGTVTEIDFIHGQCINVGIEAGGPISSFKGPTGLSFTCIWYDKNACSGDNIVIGFDAPTMWAMTGLVLSGTCVW